MVQHVKCPCAKSFHDQLRQLRPDALYHAGGQVAFDALLCLGQYLLIAFYLKLQPVFTIYPFPGKLRFHSLRFRQSRSCCRELAAASLIIGIFCRLRHAFLLRVVHEDAETVVPVMEYFFYKPAFHPFLPPALFLQSRRLPCLQAGHRQGYPVPLPS